MKGGEGERRDWKKSIEDSGGSGWGGMVSFGW